MAVRPIDAYALQERLYRLGLWNDSRAAFYELIESMPTLTPPNEWASVEERLPTLPNSDYCSVMVNTAYKDNPKSRPMIYERSVIRGKRVERWKYYWDRIADEPPDYWMPLPAPPDRRPPEGEEDT